MNNWMIEVAAEARRGRILAEMEHIRLANIAEDRYSLQAGLFGRGMLRLADWMIAAGRDLRCRYDTYSVDCGRSVSGLARQGW